jgi:hypothetical protein
MLLQLRLPEKAKVNRTKPRYMLGRGLKRGHRNRGRDIEMRPRLKYRRAQNTKLRESMLRFKRLST